MGYDIQYSLEPIIYYIDYVYGSESLFSDLTRNDLFLSSSDASSVYHHVDIESPELVDKWGISHFTLFYNLNDISHPKFKVVLYVDYRFIHYSMKRQVSLKKTSYKYDITIQYIYVEDGANLDIYKYLYYVIDDGKLNYKMEFNGKEVRVVTSDNVGNMGRVNRQTHLSINAYHYFLLVNHNARFYGDIRIINRYKLLYKDPMGEHALNFMTLLRSLGETRLVIEINPYDYYRVEIPESLENLIHHKFLFSRTIQPTFDSLDEFLDYLNNLHFYRDNIYIKFINDNGMFMSSFRERVRDSFPLVLK